MTDFKCYLPFRGEFGWMIMCFVKKFHADPHPNKIICCKLGHESLFPTATKFFYDWTDIVDSQKAGVAQVTDEAQISQKIQSWLPNDQIEFVSLSEIGWHNKHDYANHTFIPQSKHNLGLKTDIVITPRKREIDKHRNWEHASWQVLVDNLKKHGFTVGLCGTAETSFDLQHIDCKSFEHVDVDSDIELMNNAKLVVTQESGLMYLSFLCERPTFCIDHYHGIEVHRKTNVPFREMKRFWNDPIGLATEIRNFLKE